MTNSYGAVWEASELPGFPLDLELVSGGATIVVECAPGCQILAQAGSCRSMALHAGCVIANADIVRGDLMLNLHAMAQRSDAAKPQLQSP